MTPKRKIILRLNILYAIFLGLILTFLIVNFTSNDLRGNSEDKNALLKFWREIHRQDGYYEIETPIILNRHLWETSGHWYHYKENMYTVKIDEQDFAIKPMNCQV